MGMVLDMSSLRARQYEDPPIRANVRVAPKWTRAPYPTPARAREHGENIGASIEATKAYDRSSPTTELEGREGPWVTGGAACGLFQRVNPQRPLMHAEGLGVTHGQTEHYVASCNTYTTSGSELSPSWCEMRRVTANLHHDSPRFGVEDWFGGDSVMQTGAAPNAPLNGVASVALGIQQYKLEPESDDAIAAEDWSDVAHALLYPSS